MTLKEKIGEAMKTAMKTRQKERLTALKSVKSMILLAEREPGSDGKISAEREGALLAKALKQRKDSYETYQKAKREDLAAVEKLEMDVIAEFMPEQVGEEAVAAALRQAIAATGATGMRDMGKVMAAVGKQLGGSADRALTAGLAKKMLSGQ